MASRLSSLPEDGTFQPRFRRNRTGSYRIYAGRSLSIARTILPELVYPPELIAKLVDFCERKGIYLICDDIYHKLVFDRIIAHPAYEFSKKDIEDSHIIVVNGVAKVYGMTGFRVGWVVGPRELVRVMTNVTAQTTSGVSPVSQAAAEGALEWSPVCGGSDPTAD